MNSAAGTYISYEKIHKWSEKQNKRDLFFSKQRDDYLVQWLDFYGLILYV